LAEGHQLILLLIGGSEFAYSITHNTDKALDKTRHSLEHIRKKPNWELQHTHRCHSASGDSERRHARKGQHTGYLSDGITGSYDKYLVVSVLIWVSVDFSFEEDKHPIRWIVFAE